MNPIIILPIPHESHRYNTVGDYFEKNGIVHIEVSRMKDEYTFLVSLHELIEWYLTKKRGISEKRITDFDKRFKKKGEPGNDPMAPYFKEHQFATLLERLMAYELKVNWNEYENYVDKLS